MQTCFKYSWLWLQGYPYFKNHCAKYEHKPSKMKEEFRFANILPWSLTVKSYTCFRPLLWLTDKGHSCLSKINGILREKWVSIMSRNADSKYIYVSWSTSEIRVRLARPETGLSSLVYYFYWTVFCASFMLFLSLLCYAFVRICLLIPCSHLLGNGWPLGSRLWCLIVKLSLPHWYLGSGMVLDCIDSWALPSFVLHLLFWTFYSNFQSSNDHRAIYQRLQKWKRNSDFAMLDRF